MKKGVVAGVVVAVVLAVAAWRLMLPPDEPAARSGASSAVEPAATGPDAEPGPSAIVEPRRVEAIRPATFAEPEAVAATDSDLLRVLVVDEATGARVPGAEVAWTDARADAEGWQPSFGKRRTLVEDFDAGPHRAWADRQGIARIRTSNQLSVAARLGDRFGHRSFTRAPRGEIRLELVKGPLIAAKVVTTDGTPVPDVTVWFSWRFASGSVGSFFSMYSVVSRAPDGLAVADHPELRGRGSSRGELVEVSASILGWSSQSSVKATPADLERGPIRIVMPPSASLDLRLSDPDGRPLAADAQVSLTAELTGRAIMLAAASEAGISRFRAVPAAARLGITAEAAGFDSVTRTLDPLPVGEQKTVELRFVRKRPTLRGRAVDEAGGVLARQTIEVEAVNASQRLTLPVAVRIRTGDDGRFSFTLDRETYELRGSKLCFEVLGAGGAAERFRIARVPSQIFDSDEFDFGDFSLVPPKAVVSGRVTDEQGTPLSGVVVTSDPTSWEASGNREVVIGGRQLSWIGSRRVETDDDGTFRVPEITKDKGRATSFTLKAEKPGYTLESPGYAEPGEANVRVVLRGAGTLAGRLVLPELAPVSKMSICVTRAAEPRQEPVKPKVFEDCIDSSGAFRLEGLLPGVVNVEVRMSGVDEPLATVADLYVVRCRDADDARLRAIDLRSHPALRK